MFILLKEALVETRKALKDCKEALEHQNASGAKYDLERFDIPTVIYAMRALEKAEYHLMRVQPPPSPDTEDLPF